MIDKGARFRKADLHIHTPASTCFSTKEKTIKPEDIVKEAANKGLEIIGITDHNNIAFIDDVRRVAAKRRITVFPGVEITTPEAHLLAIFEPDCPMQRLNDFLPAIGILGEHRGRREAMASSFEKVLAKINEFGGIAIAPHANSSNGLLKVERGQYKIKMYKKTELCALELADQEDIGKFTKGEIPRYPAKACVCGSDAHKLSEIGQRCTYLKMDVVSINGLRQALADWMVKVRFDWDIIEPCCPQVHSLTVNQGFVSGEIFTFHPNLTCFIGGKGTGKSTVVELLRYCFNDISGIPEIRADTYLKMEKLVGAGGKITVNYLDENGDEVLVSREVTDTMYIEEGPQTITDRNGEDTVLSGKPTFFSQGEIARIAMSPIAQLDLIDKYIALSEENRQENEIFTKLDTNRASLVQTIGKHKQLEAAILDPEVGKLATKAEITKLERQLKKPIFSEFPKWESEERFIDSTIEGIKKFSEAVEQSIQDVDITAWFPAELDTTSPNYKLLRSIVEVTNKIEHLKNKVVEEIKKELESITNEANQLHGKWNPLFLKRKKEYEKYLNKIGEETVTKAQGTLRALKKRIERLGRLEREDKSCSSKETALNEERQKLLNLLREVRVKRFQKRVAKAEEWEAKLGSDVKVRIQNNGEVGKYHNALKHLLKGSYVQYQEIGKIVRAIQPDELVAAVLKKQVKWIKEQSKIRVDVASTVVDYLKQKPLGDLLDLESVPVSDSPYISFQVEPGKYKPLNELSVGTKSTVIVTLAMVEGKVPLIIDQPEDSLDTEFIFNQIVDKLRTEKDTRQFIFTSHNANVVVAGEAELTHVLSATSDKGTIKSSGGIDRAETNKLVLLHLEGGPEAFKLRAQKYTSSQQL